MEYRRESLIIDSRVCWATTNREHFELSLRLCGQTTSLVTGQELLSCCAGIRLDSSDQQLHNPLHRLLRFPRIVRWLPRPESEKTLLAATQQAPSLTVQLSRSVYSTGPTFFLSKFTLTLLQLLLDKDLLLFFSSTLFSLYSH